MTSIVYRTAVASLLTQVVIGVVTGIGYFVHIPDANDEREMHIILSVELGSQVVEFLWYLTVILRYASIETWMRYLDWIVSTPIMLCSTALFLSHRQHDFGSPFRSPYIYISLVCNWFMLAFGYAAETERIERPLALAIGSSAFVASFTSLAVCVDGADLPSVGLFWFTYVVWGGYGVAATFPYTQKNIMYNALDILSKNVYGLFLFLYVFSLA